MMGILRVHFGSKYKSAKNMNNIILSWLLLQDTINFLFYVLVSMIQQTPSLRIAALLKTVCKNGHRLRLRWKTDALKICVIQVNPTICGVLTA